MLWLALVLFISLAVALLRGGRLTNLGDIRLRAWWLLIISLALQVAPGFLPDADWSKSVGIAMILVSFGLLMLMVILNRRRTGMWLVGIGILMNLTVIAINGGMPVLAEAAEVASGFTVSSPDLSNSFEYIPLDKTSRLTFFADVIPLRVATVGQVISLGDVFFAVGLGRFLEHELRRPRRWFRKGASAQPGSAAEH